MIGGSKLKKSMTKEIRSYLHLSPTTLQLPNSVTRSGVATVYDSSSVAP
jgi:hypothetical protein